MSGERRESRRNEILELYRQGTISAQEMERLLSDVSEPQQTSASPDDKGRPSKRFVLIGLATTLLIGAIGVALALSGRSAGVPEDQVQAAIDATKESLVAETTTSDPKAEQLREEVADYQARLDACGDEAYVTEFDRLAQEALLKLAKPEQTLTQARATALLIGKRYESYGVLIPAQIKSDELADETEDISRTAADVVDAFRQSAAITNRDNFSVALTDAYLVAGDLDRAVQRLISEASKLCGES